MQRMTGEPDDADAVEAPLLLSEFLPYRLSIASEVVSRIFARTYEERFGLSIPEWRVMAVLGEHAVQTTQDVIERTEMDRVRVSRAAIKLADKGLIARKVQAQDQRAHVLSLSRRGRAVYRDIVPLARSLHDRLLGALTPLETEMLDRILLKLQARAAMDEKEQKK